LTKKVAVGDVYEGKVMRIIGRGAFVEYMTGREALVPVEYLSPKKAKRIEDLVNIGDVLKVKVFEIDSTGRINLSALGLKQNLPTLSENESAQEPTGRLSAPPRGNDHRDKDRDRGRDRDNRDRSRGGHRGDRFKEGHHQGESADSGNRHSQDEHPVFKHRDGNNEESIETPMDFPTKSRRDDEERTSPKFRPRR
jgi:predicted RNA-binding protein with RPS1 domain